MNPTLYKNGRWYKVKNLGWLRRHWIEVENFRITAAFAQLPDDEVYIVAKLKDGGIYHTSFACTNVLFNWLDRPIFRGLPATIVRPDGDYEQLTIGDVKWKSLKNHPNLHQYCLRQFPLH